MDRLDDERWNELYSWWKYPFLRRWPLVVQWVKEAWADISSDMIVRSFKKCGISNAMDGTEDNMLWEEKQINFHNDDAGLAF